MDLLTGMANFHTVATTHLTESAHSLKLVWTSANTSKIEVFSRIIQSSGLAPQSLSSGDNFRIFGRPQQDATRKYSDEKLE
ncbi:uncharacterized protein N7529_006088 [Penicillium soppii]|uniref:uncharacterized protein n=1 Tax=Penicillium soppii TaxID=69789 RepID=UPI002547A5CC|nr:uncharacterized protein N7529_006088 [Penicillium soppii]KAJ5864172.1 hypothetical protein N7529_006088 [Penicillium soppii]